MLTVEELRATAEAAIQAAANGRTVDGWREFADIGDDYADDAVSVVLREGILGEIVEAHWLNVVGADVYEARFDAVARDHLVNYAEFVEEFGNLPNSYFIEESYVRALDNYGLPEHLAIDLILNDIDPYFATPAFDWTFYVDLPPERISDQRLQAGFGLLSLDYVITLGSQGLVTSSGETLIDFGKDLLVLYIDYRHGHFFHSNQSDTQNPCFLAGTPVALAEGGEKPIDQIAVGDTVMAFDGLGDLVPARVTQVFERASDDVYDYRGDHGALGVTGNHPFLMPDGSFKPFGELVAGQDRLVDAAGQAVPFAGAERRPGSHTVYNLTVETHHTYVAGAPSSTLNEWIAPQEHRQAA